MNGINVSTNLYYQSFGPDFEIALNYFLFLAISYNATVEGGNFTATDEFGFARATKTMNSQSVNDFRWSVRITSAAWIFIGIASKLQQDKWIEEIDENAIIYFPHDGEIYTGNKLFQENIIIAKNGDEVHFRFQPKLKKFSISFVSLE